MPPTQKNTFQFGFEDNASSRYSEDDDEHAGLNPFHDDNVDEYDHDIPSSHATSPYLIPSSPTSTINHSPTFSTRSSQFEGKTSVYPAYAEPETEPTCAYPDGDSVYDFRDHLTREPPVSARYTRPFKSRLNKTGVEKPWLKEKDRREKWVTIIPLIGMAIGIGVASYLAYSGWASVETHTYCLVYEDDFSEFNQQVWNHEVQTGGYGTGEFEWTTQDPANSFVTNNTLFIMPTLTDQFLTEDQVNNGYTLNLTQQGSCTSTDVNDCVAVSNSTAQTVINPVRSARLSTKGSKSIKYGKVEVVAKLPAGNWLWPAIWMMPVNDTYGVWPESGEIDIMESRGNNINYPQGGDDTFSSTLHWGPDQPLDRWWMTYNTHKIYHTTLAADFHTYGLEWSQNRILTYIDSQLQTVLYVPFNKPRWTIGDFPLQDANGTTLVDPWSQTGRDSTPFDQEFYLILSLAVGGTNGYFPDNMANKPWVDASPKAMYDFWNAQSSWYPTWANGTGRALQIKSVKMWQQCD